MIMVADAIRLALFPAMMAFAASSDFLTLTISNRVSLILVGGGDAKLAAATALWLGFDHLLPYLLYASLLGGALSVGLIWFRMAPLPDWLARHDWAQRLHGKDAGVPYGIALAAAALAVYPQTPWMAIAT